MSVIIVYASMTGNTEEMAEIIAEGVREAGIEPEVKNVLDASANELEDYNGVILGAYTWGDGDLPDEFLDYFDEMDDVELDGKKSAVFGSGDTSYDIFCGAVDHLLAKLQDRGAVNVLEAKRIEMGPSEQEKAELRAFGKAFAEQVQTG